MASKVTNNATSTIASPVLSTATTILIASGTGAKFPILASGDWFYGTITNSSGAVEVVKVTARATDTLTVTRGVDSTSALVWATGDSFALTACAAFLTELITASSSTEPYADATGSVNALTAAYNVSASNSTLYDGYRVEVGSIGGNTVPNPTFQVKLNGVLGTALPIVKFVGSTRTVLANDDTNVGILDLRYDAVNVVWILLNPRFGATTTTPYADVTGTADAVVATYTTIPATPYDGMVVYAGITTPNTTTVPTFTAKLGTVVVASFAVQKYYGGVRVAVDIGDMQGAAQLSLDLVNNAWILLNPDSQNLIATFAGSLQASGADAAVSNVVQVTTPTFAVTEAMSGKELWIRSATTLTMPTARIGLNFKIYTYSLGTTLSVPAGSNIYLPDGSYVSSTYTLQTGAGYNQWYEVWALDGTNWVLLTHSGRQIVAPAVNPNEAVTLAQLASATAALAAITTVTDITGTTTDVTLAVNQVVRFQVTNATSIPLHVACGDNQQFEVSIVTDLLNANPSITPYLSPNNQVYGSVFTYREVYGTSGAAGGTTLGSQPYMYLFVGAKPFENISRIFTSTAYKRAISIGAGSSTLTSYQGLMCSEWQDSSTVWSSLGTISWGSGMSLNGQVFVRRIA